MLGDLVQHLHCRQIVAAHDRMWMVVHYVERLDDGDDLVLAVEVQNTKAEPAHSAALPAQVHLIRYTSEYEQGRRATKARCESAGHPLRERWSMWHGKMERNCECYAAKETRELTDEERKERMRRDPLGGSYLTEEP
jgi:hypothetical protein